MASKWKAKGCSVLVSITGTYTAIPSITDFSVDGEQSQTFEVKTLDLTRFIENPDAGFSAPPTISLNVFWDPTNTSHTTVDGLTASGTATNFKVTYSDSGPKSEIYSVTGVQRTRNATAGDGLKQSYTLTTSGAPT